MSTIAHKLYCAAIRNVDRFVLLGVIAGAGVSARRWQELFLTGRITFNDENVLTAELLAPVIGGLLPYIMLFISAPFVDEYSGGHGQVRLLKKQISNIVPPKIGSNLEGRVASRVSDLLVGLHHFDSKEADPLMKQARLSRNPYLAMRAANRYIALDKIDTGMDCIREALDWSKGKFPRPPLTSFFMQRILDLAEQLYMVMLPKSIQGYLHASLRRAFFDPQGAWYYSELGRQVVCKFEESLEKPMKKEMYVFHALLASAQRRSDERDAWRDAIRLLMDSGEVESASSRETRSRVFRFSGDFFANTLVVKQRPSIESLVSEYEWTRRAGEYCPSGVKVPECVYVSDEGDELSCLALRFCKGDVLYERLEKGDKSAVLKVADALGCFARLPGEGLARQDLRAKAQGKLADVNLGVSVGLQERVLGAYSVIVDACSKVPWVPNGDKHPEQWIQGEELVALDWEVDGLVPLSFDPANFLSYRSFFNPNEERDFIARYAQSCAKVGFSVEPARFLPAYHAGVAHRALCFASAWSDPKRVSMRNYRREVLLRGARAFRDMAHDCSAFSENYKRELAVLEDSYQKMADLMVS